MKKLVQAIKLAGVMGGMGLVWQVVGVAAQNVQIKPGGTDFTPLTSLKVETMIPNIITWVLILAAIAFFFMLVIGGVRWILSGGEKTSVEAARNQITNALIGLVIVFAAWAILTLIGTLFGVAILSGEQGITLPTLQGKVGVGTT